MSARIVLLATLLAMLAPAGQADVYKCRLADGRIEYSNTGCQNSSPLSVRRDETVSPENRAQAERDLERMRAYLDEREAAGRTAPPNATAAGASSPPGPSPSAVDDCLRDLERQAMSAEQRAKMEASCRSTGGNQPFSESEPIYGGGIGRCLRNVDRRHLSPAERARRINQCQGVYVPTPQPVLPVKPPKPSEAPAGKTVVSPGAARIPCPNGRTNCGR